MKPYNSGREEHIVHIGDLCLDHTNGCTGYDSLMQGVIQKSHGRKYSATAIEYLNRELNAGRYSTADVKIWIIDRGYIDATLTEATNLRYRLMKDFPIKGWYASKFSKD